MQELLWADGPCCAIKLSPNSDWVLEETGTHQRWKEGQNVELIPLELPNLAAILPRFIFFRGCVCAPVDLTGSWRRRRFIPRLSSCLGCDTQMTRLAGPDLGWQGLIGGGRGGFGVLESNLGW